MTQYRTIFLSDIHLGTRGCNATALLDFLRTHDSDKLVFLGDIIDFWRLKYKVYWPAEHNLVIQKVLRKARRGTEVIYIPGNHDENLREYVGINLGGIELVKEAVHITADGKRLLLIHGDEFDGIVKYHRWIALLGDYAYTVLLNVNRYFNWTRKHLGMNYWSLSAYLKKRVKEAASFISNFEEAVAHECKHRGFDGIICGHIHHADIRYINGIIYANDGDMVESCTAIVELYDGTMQILKYVAPGEYKVIKEILPDGTINSF
jgi:UDP-2,3-diacylglucosamine pyrophosphatase LpxH